MVDPCQNQQSPLKTQTLLPSGVALANDPSSTTAGSLIYRGSIARNTGAQWVPLPDWSSDSRSLVSTANTDNVAIIDSHQMVTILAIHMTAAGGAATAPVQVSVSVDNITYTVVDTIAAAAQTDLQYTQTANVLNGAAQAGTASGTGAASTMKLNPLAFRYIKVNAQAGGASVVTTLIVSMK